MNRQAFFYINFFVLNNPIPSVEALCSVAVVVGCAKPPTPSAIRPPFTEIIERKFLPMRFIIAVLSFLSVMILPKSFSDIVMSAISLAIAAPLEMAIPTSAEESAGESFTPSPIITTVLPFAFSLNTKCAFSY